MLEERKCINCGIEITGRRNKVYCSKKCSNDYLNELNYDTKRLFNEEEKNLRANYKRVRAVLSKHGNNFIIEKEKAQRIFIPEFITYSSDKFNRLYNIIIITKKDTYEFRLQLSN